MQGGGNNTGTRGNIGKGEALEEFFSDSEEVALEPTAESSAPQKNLSDEEEIRRLTAYIAYLKERIAETGKPLARRERLEPSGDNAVRRSHPLLAGLALVLACLILTGRRSAVSPRSYGRRR